MESTFFCQKKSLRPGKQFKHFGSVCLCIILFTDVLWEFALKGKQSVPHRESGLLPVEQRSAELLAPRTWPVGGLSASTKPQTPQSPVGQ